MSCTHVLGRLLPGGCLLCLGVVEAARPTATPGPPTRGETRLLEQALTLAHIDGIPSALVVTPNETIDLTGEAAIDLLRDLDRDACRSSLAEFVRLAFLVVLPGVELEWGPHLQAVCDHVQWQLEDRDACVRDPHRKRRLKAQNLLINLPPRSLKTIILTCATVWAWLRWPTLHIMYLSANPRVASASARMARDLIRSPWYCTTFAPRWDAEEIDGATGDPISPEEWERRNPVEPEAWEIRSDQDALSDLGNTAGGVRVARGLSSVITGSGADWLCVARGTLVATEVGDITVEDLIAMQPRPRVWTQNHRTGARELKPITSWHVTPRQRTITVRTSSGNVLRCTDDHRIWTSDGYLEARACAGRTVSVLRRSESPGESRNAETLHALQHDHAGLPGVCEAVHAQRGGARQGAPARSTDNRVQRYLPRADAASGTDVLRELRGAVLGVLESEHAAVLLPRVLGRVSCEDARAEDADRQAVRALQGHDEAVDDQDAVLLEALQERGAQPADGRARELELQRHSQGVSRRVVGQRCTAHPRARREPLRDLWYDVGEDAGRSPRQSRSEGQHAGEPDHALRCLPHDPPQVQATTVLSVDAEASSGSDQTDDVFDINVEGNHNFFAGGILVHNCVDDAHDVRDGHDKVAKAVEDYDSAVHNRINDPRTSIRTCIMQRCRPNDLSAKWLLLPSVVHLRLPMEYEPPYEVECKCGTCTGVNVYGFVDWRTVKGESLQPRFDAVFIEGEKKRLLSHYLGQHQQRPLEPGGQIFKVAWWNWFSLTDDAPKARPKGARASPAFVIGRRRDGSLELDGVDISVDATGGATTESASNLGIGVIGRKDERRFLLRDLTAGPATWLQTMEQLRNAVLVTAKVCGKQPKLTVLIESKQFGKAAIEQLEKHILDGDLRYPDGTAIRARVEPYEPSGKGDKGTRIELMEPDIAAGLVYLEDGEHETSEVRDEIEGYPKASKNDRCDYLAQALDHRRKHVDDWRQFFKDRREAALSAARARQP